jgi:hypothetical protein
MKSVLSIISIFSILIQPYAFGQTSENGQDTQNLSLTQAVSEVQLEQDLKEPIYATQQQASTCYRDVQQGSHQECQTLSRHDCHTETSQQCQNVSFPVCQNVPQNVCQSIPFPVCTPIQRNQCDPIQVPVCQTIPQNVCVNVPSQECSAVTVPVCQSVPRRQCQMVQQCTTVMDQVCHGTAPNQVCQSVPRRQCDPVEQCQTVNDSVCHNEVQQQCHSVNHQQCHIENQQQCHNETQQRCHTVNDSVCHNETRQECHTENQQQCHNESRQECQNVPHDVCTDIPYQACHEVPNMGREPYSCMKPVQVQVGERIKGHIYASVQVVIQNFAQVDVIEEKLIARLINGKVQLTSANTSRILFQITSKKQKLLSGSGKDQRFSVVYTLKAITQDQIRELAGIQIKDTLLRADRIEFKLVGANLSQLAIKIDSGHIKLKQMKMVSGVKKALKIIDQNFDAKLVKSNGDGFELFFSSLGVKTLKAKEYALDFILGSKVLLNRGKLLNPELLDQMGLTPIETTFNGQPRL